MKLFFLRFLSNHFSHRITSESTKANHSVSTSLIPISLAFPLKQLFRIILTLSPYFRNKSIVPSELNESTTIRWLTGAFWKTESRLSLRHGLREFL